MAAIEWTFSGSGVAITITVDTSAQTLTISSDAGSFDLNALWLSDGDATKDGAFGPGWSRRVAPEPAEVVA